MFSFPTPPAFVGLPAADALVRENIDRADYRLHVGGKAPGIVDARRAGWSETGVALRSAESLAPKS
jgi:hypothetical protein